MEFRISDPQPTPPVYSCAPHDHAKTVVRLPSISESRFEWIPALAWSGAIAVGLLASSADGVAQSLPSGSWSQLPTGSGSPIGHILKPCELGIRFHGVSFPAGSEPSSVTSADLDGDGDQDLLVANRESDDVSVLLGVGDGTFLAHGEVGVGNYPVSVVAADLNGDGVFDLAVANQFGGSVSVALGVGDGSFGLAVDYGVGNSPCSVIVTDLNGDGIQDLATANRVGLSVSVLQGIGDGTFVGHLDYAVAGSPQQVVAADLDGDGDQDLATANIPGTSVLLGLGDGTFGASTEYGSGAAASSLTVADLNGDGNEDIALSHGSVFDGRVHVLLGVGDGTFELTSELLVGENPVTVVSSDLNGDGIVDLAALCDAGNAVASHVVSVLLGLGDGTFGPHEEFGVGGGPVTWLAAADLNGDGAMDLVVCNSIRSGVMILLGKGDGSYIREVEYAVGPDPRSVTLADFDADGDEDMVVANFAGDSVSVLLNLGNGTFTPSMTYATGGDPMSVAVADMDGDGDEDLAVANNSSHSISVLLGNGDGTFAAHIEYAAASFPRCIIAEDLDGDGAQDLAAGNFGAASMSVFLGPGDGTFPARVDYPLAHLPLSITAGDFDGDGEQDLASAGQSLQGGNPGSVAIFLGLGDGSFMVNGTFTTELFPHAVLDSDVDDDGVFDLIVTCTTLGGGSVWVFRGFGDGTFGLASAYQPSGHSTVHVDLDGDGVRDLATARYHGGVLLGLVVHPGSSNGSFDSSEYHRVGLGLSSVASADLDGDGDQDLVGVANFFDTVFVLLNRCR